MLDAAIHLADERLEEKQAEELFAKPNRPGLFFPCLLAYACVCSRLCFVCPSLFRFLFCLCFVLSIFLSVFVSFLFIY